MWHHEESSKCFKGFGFYPVGDLELQKGYTERSDRIKFAFGKISLAVHWEMGWRGEMLEVSLSGSQVQKWPAVAMRIERSGSESS